MSSYLRPVIDAPVFRDADGVVIEYGNRWAGGSPPEETYSVDTHPERFAPIHAIADALIAHLNDVYDVELTTHLEVATDLIHPAPDVTRAVRVTPNDPSCAALTFVFTSYPGVFLHAGLLHDFHYPVCGCDACDETWESVAEELEQQMLAVATGNYREIVERGLRPGVGYAFTYPDGAASGRARAQDLPKPRLQKAKPLLQALRDGWSAWPRRS